MTTIRLYLFCAIGFIVPTLLCGLVSIPNPIDTAAKFFTAPVLPTAFLIAPIIEPNPHVLAISAGVFITLAAGLIHLIVVITKRRLFVALSVVVGLGIMHGMIVMFCLNVVRGLAT